MRLECTDADSRGWAAISPTFGPRTKKHEIVCVRKKNETMRRQAWVDGGGAFFRTHGGPHITVGVGYKHGFLPSTAHGGGCGRGVCLRVARKTRRRKRHSTMVLRAPVGKPLGEAPGLLLWQRRRRAAETAARRQCAAGAVCSLAGRRARWKGETRQGRGGGRRRWRGGGRPPVACPHGVDEGLLKNVARPALEEDRGAVARPLVVAFVVAVMVRLLLCESDCDDAKCHVKKAHGLARDDPSTGRPHRVVVVGGGPGREETTRCAADLVVMPLWEGSGSEENH